jgi:putative intracellular protease/amidase
MHAQIVLFDGFDPLDVIAPFEVLAAGSEAVGGDRRSPKMTTSEDRSEERARTGARRSRDMSSVRAASRRRRRKP